jgi:Spy/CpxP family protein refolding chaperone
MKFDVRKSFSLALACVLLAGMALAEGPGGPRGGAFFGEHMLGFMSDYLDLSEAQQTQIKAIMEKQKSALEPLFQQEMQSHEQMRQIIESATFDEAKAQSIAAQSSQIHQQLMVQQARAMNEAYQVLTADQKTKLAQFMAKRQQRFAQHMQGGADHEAPPNE